MHGVAGVDADDNLFVLDWWRQQTASDIWIDVMLDLVSVYKPLTWAEEKGQIEKSVGPFLNKRMRERRVYCHQKQYSSAHDKPTRAQSIVARMAMGKVYFPRNAPWVDELVSELLRFPYGKTDDQVDVLSLFGRMLNGMIGAAKTVEEPKPKFDYQAGQGGAQMLGNVPIRELIDRQARRRQED